MHRELISKTESIETLKCIIQSNEKWIEQEKKRFTKDEFISYRNLCSRILFM